RWSKTEQKCEIAVDAFLLKKFGCPDALPGAGDLDQDAFTRHALLLIQRDELARLGNRRRGIEAQARGDLRGDTAGHHFEDFTSEQNKKTINESSRHLIVAAAALKRKFGSLFHQAPVGRHLGGVKKKRRIGGGILRPVPSNGLNITGIRYNCRVFLQRFKQCHCSLLSIRSKRLDLLA